MEEIWKPIIIKQNGVVYDFTGKYEVSNLGRVRSLNYGGHTGKIGIMKGCVYKDGYVRVSLKSENKNSNFLVHRLVATVFIPNPDNLPEVNHRNEDKTDNRVENLEWCTREYNANYGTAIERQIKQTKGEKHHQARKVICLETGQVFGCIKEAEEWLVKGNVGDCCRHKQRTAGGYHWKYYTDYLLDINKKNELLVA